MKLFFVSISVALLASITFARDAAEENEYWKRAHLNFAQIERLATNGNCGETRESFHGCLAVIDVLLAKLSKPLQLITAAEWTKGGGYGPVQIDFGGLKAVLPEKIDEKDPAQNLLKYKTTARAHSRARNAFYEQHSKAVSFEKIISRLKPQVINAANDGVIAGLALNAYMARAIDPHASAHPKALWEKEMIKNEDSFTGIGAMLTKIHDKLVIQSPLEGSPALSAGLRAKDVIVAVNGESVEGLELDSVTAKIKGPEGSTVEFTIDRTGRKFKVTVVRARIVTANVEAKVLQDAGSRISYVKLRGFSSQDSCSNIVDSLVQNQKQGAQQIILDLRGNPGGLLDQAVCVSNIFLPKNRVVVQEKILRTGSVKELRTEFNGNSSIPLVVMIDSNSASASEIVSGALQDYRRAWLVGTRSFGKGSVQSPTPLSEIPVLGRLASTLDIWFYTTTARFYRPGGITNQMIGITPDFEVYSNPKPTADDMLGIREEDVFPEALPPTGEKWTQTRPEAVRAIQGCIRDSGRSQALFAQHANDPIPPDYQLFYAEDVLDCAQAR